jgi:hypothetical protein
MQRLIAFAATRIYLSRLYLEFIDIELLQVEVCAHVGLGECVNWFRLPIEEIGYKFTCIRFLRNGI